MLVCYTHIFHIHVFVILYCMYNIYMYMYKHTFMYKYFNYVLGKSDSLLQMCTYIVLHVPGVHMYMYVSCIRTCERIPALVAHTIEIHVHIHTCIATLYIHVQNMYVHNIT